MAKATIPLAKGYNLMRMALPIFISRKFDGVPVKITVTGGYKVSWESRSGEPLPSCSEYMRHLSDKLQQRPQFLPDQTVVIVAEITHKTLMSFKDISGVIRRQEPQEDLVFNVFDIYVGDANEQFNKRLGYLYNVVDKLSPDFRAVNQRECNSYLEAEETIDMLQRASPEWEGLIARGGNATFKPNARHWDYQKIVVDPTVDLRIVGMEEALSKKDPVTGERTPLGMAGRLIANYKGNRIGIGPGKLSHDERRELWQYHQKGIASGDRIATIKYKRDDTYTALRQPTFQHWRPEKTEESYE